MWQRGRIMLFAGPMAILVRSVGWALPCSFLLWFKGWMALPGAVTILASWIGRGAGAAPKYPRALQMSPDILLFRFPSRSLKAYRRSSLGRHEHSHISPRCPIGAPDAPECSSSLRQSELFIFPTTGFPPMASFSILMYFPIVAKGDSVVCWVRGRFGAKAWMVLLAP